MSKQNRGREIREEGDARTRARESVEQPVLEKEKRMEKTKGVLHGKKEKLAEVEGIEKTKGVLHGEKEKLAEVEGQIDGISHWEEKKLKQVGEQKGQAAVCWCIMGPTSMAKGRNRVRKENKGLGVFGGVMSNSNRAQTNQFGPLLSLDPADNKLSPLQTGLSKNPAEKHVNAEQQICTFLAEWKMMKQPSKGTPINNWKGGDRRVDQDVLPLLENDVSRYVKPTHEDFPSSKISSFGRPLLTGGSSDQEDPLKLKEIDVLVPLRMVAVDGREWGMESSDALEAFEEGPRGEGQREDESASGKSEGSGYENWEDSCLIKFSEFLGFSTVGFESEILDLLRKIVARQHQGAVTTTRCERELKKLVCTINYDGRSQIKGGDKERGSLMLRSK